MKGRWILILHAHLPFVRHPEHEHFLEEDWLYEAMAETYLPLLDAIDRLRGTRARFTLTMSPPLCEMLRDPLLVGRFRRRLNALCELADREIVRTKHEPRFAAAAAMHRDHFHRVRDLFENRYGRDIVGGFAKAQSDGAIEVMTTTATHGFLPLMIRPEARRAQVGVAVDNYRKHFGRAPRGIWLAECGYAEGVEAPVKEFGLKYFIVDTHGVLYARPRPRFGVFAPVRCGNGVAAFARDPESSLQVWSAERGYPGDVAYREFYRDLGYDAPMEHIKPYLHPDGVRRNVGFKYFRVTGKVALHEKQPYDPAAAAAKADEHAGNFVFNREHQSKHLAELLGRPPAIVSPYDAELYGHWWFEGPRFLEGVLKRMGAAASTPSDALEAEGRLQAVEPCGSSWGDGGYAKTWLAGENSWMYRHLHEAEEHMAELARTQKGPHVAAALRQLLLAQSSDWAFILSTKTTVPYATRRFREHITRFHRFARGERDADAESRDTIFPELDPLKFA